MHNGIRQALDSVILSASNSAFTGFSGSHVCHGAIPLDQPRSAVRDVVFLSTPSDPFRCHLYLRWCIISVHAKINDSGPQTGVKFMALV